MQLHYSKRLDKGKKHKLTMEPRDWGFDPVAPARDTSGVHRIEGVGSKLFERQVISGSQIETKNRLTLLSVKVYRRRTPTK